MKELTSVTLVNGENYEINTSSVNVVIGKNNTGKTTIALAIAGTSFLNGSDTHYYSDELTNESIFQRIDTIVKGEHTHGSFSVKHEFDFAELGYLAEEHKQNHPDKNLLFVLDVFYQFQEADIDALADLAESTGCSIVITVQTNAKEEITLPQHDKENIHYIPLVSKGFPLAQEVH